MSKNVIFCYSGSGNCLDIAKNIAKRLGDTDIVMMRAEPEVKDVRGAKRVGFVFPCYAGGLPGDVEKFVSELRVDPESYTFGVVSYAGYPGVGMAKINDIVPLDYWAGISHQCSCIWLMPHTLMLPMLDASRAQERSEKLAAKIADDVKVAKEKFDTLQTTHAAELAKISKRSALQMALNGKVYDPSDIIGLLDMDKIEVSDDGSLKTDLEGLLKPIKESKAYLFKEDPAKTPPVHGATPADPGPKTPPAAGKVDGPVCL